MSSVINLGFISIHIYSIMILLGLLVGGKLVIMEGKKWNLPENFVFNLLFWAFIIGIIGARIYYVIFNFNSYKDKTFSFLTGISLSLFSYPQ